MDISLQIDFRNIFSSTSKGAQYNVEITKRYFHPPICFQKFREINIQYQITITRCSRRPPAAILFMLLEIMEFSDIRKYSDIWTYSHIFGHKATFGHEDILLTRVIFAFLGQPGQKFEKRATLGPELSTIEHSCKILLL